jgi:hypothetical protein
MAPRKQFLLRVDPELWRELERWAADELRSVNGQVEYLLREAVRRRKGAAEGGGPAEGGDGEPSPPSAGPGAA